MMKPILKNIGFIIVLVNGWSRLEGDPFHLTVFSIIHNITRVDKVCLFMQIPHETHPSSVALHQSHESSEVSAVELASDELSTGIIQDKPSTSSVSDNATPLPVVPYPAPLPKFSPTIAEVLLSGNKARAMLMYGEIEKEAKNFCAAFIPTDTANAKASLANIGRSMILLQPIGPICGRTSMKNYCRISETVEID
jgi:hypothetical protein